MQCPRVDGRKVNKEPRGVGKSINRHATRRNVYTGDDTTPAAFDSNTALLGTAARAPVDF